MASSTGKIHSGKAGVDGVVTVSAGFKETDNKGKRSEFSYA